jgi:hypothetical protein
MNGNNNEEVKTYVQLLFNKYGSLVLDIETTSKITTRSVISLRRDLAESTGIPCTKTGKGNGSDQVKYGIYDIATYLVRKKIKTYNL